MVRAPGRPYQAPAQADWLRRTSYKRVRARFDSSAPDQFSLSGVGVVGSIADCDSVGAGFESRTPDQKTRPTHSLASSRKVGISSGGIHSTRSLRQTATGFLPACGVGAPHEPRIERHGGFAECPRRAPPADGPARESPRIREPTTIYATRFSKKSVRGSLSSRPSTSIRAGCAMMSSGTAAGNPSRVRINSRLLEPPSRHGMQLARLDQRSQLPLAYRCCGRIGANLDELLVSGRVAGDEVHLVAFRCPDAGHVKTPSFEL